MGEEIIFPVNDTYRAITRIINDLKSFDDNPRVDGRAKAIVITKLEEAQLRSLTIIKSEDDSTAEGEKESTEDENADDGEKKSHDDEEEATEDEKNQE